MSDIVNAELARIKRERSAREKRAQEAPELNAAGAGTHVAKPGAEILQQVFDFLGRFVVFPSEEAQTATALWAVHTHLMDRWESTPRLAFLSPEPGSGKTRALEILDLLVPRPVQPVNSSAAYVFRRVASDDGPPTILFDEIDTIFGPKAKENEDLRGFINAGHRRGAIFGRCVVRGRTIEPEDITAYCAVALAGLGWLPDTILSRSIVVRMRRRHDGEQIEPFRHRRHAPQGRAIGHEIETWAQTFPTSVEWPTLPDGIEDRNADIWEPLIAIAEVAGGIWPARSRKAAVVLVTATAEQEPPLGIQLLRDLQTIFGDASQLSSKEILSRLHCLEEAPWNDLKSRPLDERGLAYRLRQYGVRSKTLRLGEATPKGYTKADLYDAWRRYLSLSPSKSATSATNIISLEIQKLNVADGPQHVADVADSSSQAPHKKPNGFNGVSDVAGVAHFQRDERSEPRKCAQCNAPDDGKLQDFDGELLHKECKSFFFGER